MKFLPPEKVRPNIIPLTIQYYTPKTFEEPDILTIIYKDVDTGERFIHNISEPKIEAYITKPEKRTFSHMRDYTTVDECDKFLVKYRTRWSTVAKYLKLNSGNDAKMSPYVFNIDIPIESYYLIQFLLEYPCSRQRLSLGKLDIENDIIRTDRFAEPGTCPINAVTYINMETNDVYTLVLLKDHLWPMGHVRYSETAHLRDKFYDQVKEVLDHPEKVLAACHEKFDELYPNMNYNILYYDDEVQLLKDLWKIIHSTDNDFIGIWNLPYDMQNLIERAQVLGLDPYELICDDRFIAKRLEFREDKNPTAHKRRHHCVTSTIPTFVDDMVHYAGIRAGGGVLPSTRLNYVAERELKDSKYDYSEVSDIKHLYYDDLIRFILYNIKDVLLMCGIENKTKDTSNIYSRMLEMAVFPREAFTTTKVVWHSLIKFMAPRGFIPGTNRNRGNHTKVIVDYSKIYGEAMNKMTTEEIVGNSFDFLTDEYGEIFSSENNESEEENGGDEKSQKFPGAWVMNTQHMSSTGFKVMGTESQFIHDNVADSDVTSEYPTAINTTNVSNETLVGRVYLSDPDSINIPLCPGYVFKGDDAKTYKFNPHNFLMEAYTEQDPLNFGKIFLGLPDADSLLDGFENFRKS